jgi:PAS domain-containing protein
MEFVSDGCRELTGYEPGAIIGNRLTSYEEIIDPQDRKAVRNVDRKRRGPRGGVSSSPTGSARATAPPSG